MNGTSAQVLREHDPKYLKRRRWERRGVIVVAILAVVAVGAAGYAVASAFRTEKRITKVEQSACTDAQQDPTDLNAIAECQKVRAAAERTANENVNCIPFLRAGYVCPRPGSPLAEQRRSREIREAVGPHGGAPAPIDEAPPVAEGGGATSSPSSGHSLPAPGDGGAGEHGSGGGHGAPGPGNGGSHGTPDGGEGAPAAGTPTAPAPTAPSSPGTSSSSTTEHTPETAVEERPSTEAEAPVLSAVGGLTESVGATVEGLDETAGGTVEGVASTTCTLAKLLCP